MTKIIGMLSIAGVVIVLIALSVLDSSTSTDIPGWFTAVAVVAGIIAPPLYFAPWLVALRNASALVLPIFLINLVFGWTAIGWVGCLIAAFVNVEGDD